MVGLALEGKQGKGVARYGATGHVVSRPRQAAARGIRQGAVTAQSNASTAAPYLLAGLDLTTRVMTMDALLTQAPIARQIRQYHGHDRMIAKDNHPSLAAARALLFAEDGPQVPTDYRAQHQTVEKHHGRLETRTLARSAARNASLDWPDGGQVLRRTTRVVERKTGVVRQKVSDGLTSLPAATTTPAQVEQLWRGHWTLAKRVHDVREVTFGDETGHRWVGKTSHALTGLRNLLLALLRGQGWTNIAAALRHDGTSAGRALLLFQSAHSDFATA